MKLWLSSSEKQSSTVAFNGPAMVVGGGEGRRWERDQVEGGGGERLVRRDCDGWNEDHDSDGVRRIMQCMERECAYSWGVVVLLVVGYGIMAGVGSRGRVQRYDEVVVVDGEWEKSRNESTEIPLIPARRTYARRGSAPEKRP